MEVNKLITHREVVNLSDITLTLDQTEILSKGLNFCPTPGLPNPGDMRTDLDQFHRRIRLYNHFKDNENDNIQIQDNLFSEDEFAHPKFKPPSHFNPIGTPILETFITLNEHDFDYRNQKMRYHKDNLTSAERKALKELMVNEDYH